MNNHFRNILIIFTVLLLCAGTVDLSARTKVTDKAKDKNQLQREALRVKDIQKNTVSNIEFFTTNYGIFALDIENNVGGGYWPRNSRNQYIFGGGIWFAAMKPRPTDPSSMKKYVEVSYNPNSGQSWMVPGRIADGDAQLDDDDARLKYRVYFSTDFRKNDGVPFNEDDGPEWPIWDASDNEEDTLKVNRYFGYYVDDIENRNLDAYEKGPAFISGEDIFATFKDTDLKFYEGGKTRREEEGYPMSLQFEHTIYSWGFGDYRDFIFMRYDIINYSDDTLWNCWLAPVMDIDIARAPNTQAGADNDRVRFYDEEDTLNLAFQWTNTDRGEKGYGFGYLGFDFLESPSVLRCEESFDSVLQVKKTDINGAQTVQDQIVTFCRMCADFENTVVFVIDPETGGTIAKDTTICLRKTTFVSDPFFKMCYDSKDTVIQVDDGSGNIIDKDTVLCFRSMIDEGYFSEGTENFVRKDKRYYANQEQIGLVTFRNWPIQEDKIEDEDRYNYMSSRVRDGDDGPGDKRFMMATGPFHLVPRDTVRVVVGVIIANPAVKEDADGSTEDVQELIRKDKFAQKVYDENFRAPTPPERAMITYWEPLNNGILVKWDSTSEMSTDKYEQGMDFLGYRLYRARRLDLDTFDINDVAPTTEYPSGKGPFGWKQIAEWSIPTPFYKSVRRSGINPDDMSMPFIDSLRILGPLVYPDRSIDTFAIRVLRVAKGMILVGPDKFLRDNNMPLVPIIASMDTSLVTAPWGKYFSGLVNEASLPLMYQNPPITGDINHHPIFDNASVGLVTLNRALLNYNPLFWTRKTTTINPVDTATLPDSKNDTIYLKDTYRTVDVDGTVRLVIDQLVPKPVGQIFTDTLHIRQALDSIYAYIQNGKANIDFPAFEQSMEAKNEVILPYMKERTNNRTFVDLGDDDRSAYIATNDNPAKTERIINNVDYYYKLLAWDEGDYNQPTPLKLNDGFLGLPNVEETYPRAATAGKESEFQITFVDSNKIGGLYNFRFYSIDQQRVNQKFAGHELELEFLPYWSLSSLQFAGMADPKEFGLYRRRMILRDLTTDQILFDGITNLEATPCNFSYRGSFTENAFSWVLADSAIIDTITGTEITFGLPDNDERVLRSGLFSSGDFNAGGFGSCYTGAMNQPAYGTIGFGFDLTLQQRGGIYRPDPTKTEVVKSAAGAITPIQALTAEDEILSTTWVYDIITERSFSNSRFFPQYGSFNNGPGDYLITFKQPEGPGTEELTLVWGRDQDETATFTVPYLEMEITNIASYKRPYNVGSLDSVDVTYPGPVEYMQLPDSLITEPVNAMYADIKYNYIPSPIFLHENSNEFINKFNIHSFAWVDTRTTSSVRDLRYLSARDANRPSYLLNQTTNVGSQGRYYLSGTSPDGLHTVDFANAVQISGCTFVFDYANKGRRVFTAGTEWDPVSDDVYPYGGPDFQAGDQVIVRTTGGALGLPLPGAKVRCLVSESVPSMDDYTEEILDQVRVVPNPYYITHQGQRSPYDSKIYFTRLPKECTIDIYTSNGDHIIQIDHNEYQSYSPDKAAVSIWDLLTKNKQRISSQALVAVITTPNGEQTVKNFSVVVGGFRLIEEE